MATTAAPAPTPAASAPQVTRRKRDPLSPDAVEAVARQSVINDFNRLSDFKRVTQAYRFAKEKEGAASTSGKDDVLLATSFVQFFSAVTNSAKKVVRELSQDQTLAYTSPPTIAQLSARWGKGATNPQLFTPNIVRHTIEGEGATKKAPFTVATERLPLDALEPEGSLLSSSANLGAIVKNLPTRINVEHRYTTQNAGLQQTSAYVVAGIGCFGTFCTVYFGAYHNRALFAATPLMLMVTYSSFALFETADKRAKYASKVASN